MNTKLEEEVTIASKAAKREAVKLQQRVRIVMWLVMWHLIDRCMIWKWNWNLRQKRRVTLKGIWKGKSCLSSLTASLFAVQVVKLSSWISFRCYDNETHENWFLYNTDKINWHENSSLTRYLLTLPLRNDRRYKEVVSQVEEEKTNAQRLQDQVNSLNTKIRNLRRDKEETESEVETVQRKLRQAKSSLDDAEQENSTLTAQLSKVRSGAAGGRKPKVDIYETISVLAFPFFPQPVKDEDED